MMSVEQPVLIVGGGLAGTTLAWRLWERKVPFRIVDPDLPDTCSKIAAGLITPITGMRLNVSSRLPELLPVAREFYAKVEGVLGVKVHHSVPLVRLLKNEREKKLWATRQHEADVRPWLEEASPGSPLVDEEVFHAEHGGFEQRDSGWLDAALYLKASRDFFSVQGSWMTSEVRDADLEAAPDAVRWNGEVFQAAVLCRGSDERHAPRFFPWLKWDCARGVIARLEAAVTDPRIINRGCWLLPRDGAWRTGSTYEFDFEAPMEKSVELLRAKLQGLLKGPFTLRDPKAGIRPILKKKQVVLGRHPAHPRVALFNGLGSKGALQAPFFSAMLAAHLVDDAPLDEVTDLAAND